MRAIFLFIAIAGVALLDSIATFALLEHRSLMFSVFFPILISMPAIYGCVRDYVRAGKRPVNAPKPKFLVGDRVQLLNVSGKAYGPLLTIAGADWIKDEGWCYKIKEDSTRWLVERNIKREAGR